MSRMLPSLIRCDDRARRALDDLFEKCLRFLQRLLQGLDLRHIPDALQDVRDLPVIIENGRKDSVLPLLPSFGILNLAEDGMSFPVSQDFWKGAAVHGTGFLGT